MNKTVTKVFYPKWCDIERSKNFQFDLPEYDHKKREQSDCFIIEREKILKKPRDLYLRTKNLDDAETQDDHSVEIIFQKMVENPKFFTKQQIVDFSLSNKSFFNNQTRLSLLNYILKHFQNEEIIVNQEREIQPEEIHLRNKEKNVLNENYKNENVDPADEKRLIEREYERKVIKPEEEKEKNEPEKRIFFDYGKILGPEGRLLDLTTIKRYALEGLKGLRGMKRVGEYIQFTASNAAPQRVGRLKYNDRDDIQIEDVGNGLFQLIEYKP